MTDNEVNFLTHPPLSQRTLTRPPGGLFGEVTAADSATVVVAVFARSLVNLGRAARDVLGDRLSKVRRHFNLAGPSRFVSLVAAEECQAWPS